MASRGVNKTELIWLYESGKSIPQVSEETGLHRSTVRYHLRLAGALRSRGEGVRIAATNGRLGSGVRGKQRVFSEQWKNNISQARIAFSEAHAAGTSLKPNGYLEVTKGEHKGRGQHRVVGAGMAISQALIHAPEPQINKVLLLIG